ncbi:DUF2378 family protein [Aggregicoccus sp. 17bor-14]|uniref:DUF2378 family protein n=1 Tax=Myxococcaceae TaxID=31 RepID=UPI003519DAC5
MTPRLVFQPTMQSLLHALGPRLDAGCAARLLQVGVNTEAPLLDAYPVSVFAAALRVAAGALAPGLPEEEGVRRVGRCFVQRFSETRLGRAGLTLARLMGPEYLVRHFGQAIRLGDNYTQVHAQQQAPRHFLVTVHPAQLPGFYVGLFEEGLRALGASAVEAQLHALHGEGFVFSVRWS